MHIIGIILLILFFVGLVLQISWMGITWMWAVLMRGLHIPVASMVTAFFVFRISNVLFKRVKIATFLSIASGVFMAWILMDYFYFRRFFNGIMARYFFGRIGPGQVMSTEASVVLAYCIAFVATLITTFRGRRAGLSPEQLEEKRAKALSSAKGFWDTLVLFSYGEYISRGRQVDIVFVILPVAGVLAFLIGIWKYLVG